MPAASLVTPDERFERSYRTLVEEFKARGERLVPFTLSFSYEKFHDLVATLHQHAKGVGIPDGFVPNSSYWLVQGYELLGVSNLRHRLTDALNREGGHIGYGIRPSVRGRGLGKEILRQTLERARGIGLTRVLLTCGKGNTASAGVIVANGGVLESEEYYPPRNEVLQRYWIELVTADRRS